MKSRYKPRYFIDEANYHWVRYERPDQVYWMKVVLEDDGWALHGCKYPPNDLREVTDDKKERFLIGLTYDGYI
jgi:hypothetical protein